MFSLFNVISTFVGYLIPMPSLYSNRSCNIEHIAGE